MKHILLSLLFAVLVTYMVLEGTVSNGQKVPAVKSSPAIEVRPQAASIRVDCEAGGKIGAALVNMKPGDTLLVKGTCRENVVITTEMARLILDGQGTATIDAPDFGRGAIDVTGRDITIRGFTITGGRHGINVVRGSTAIIANNVIHHTGSKAGPGRGFGVEIGQQSFASIVGNTIRDNPRYGIHVGESSAARIGFTDIEIQGGGNVIENNGQFGVAVSGSSNARIIGNTIRKNRDDGVQVNANSNARISGNVISGNGGSGVFVTDNSNVIFGENIGSTNPYGAPNTTEASLLNVGVGIRCENGGSVKGRLGALSGREGAKRFDKTCIDSNLN